MIKYRLAIRALDTSGKILSQVEISINHNDEDLREVMPVARNMLRIKGCSRVEIRPLDSTSSQYEDSPLAVLHASDLYWGSSVS
jgi:hypothetical protein